MCADASQDRPGEVEIAPVLSCPCEFMCIYSDYESKKYTCYCKPNYVLADDQETCIGQCKQYTCYCKLNYVLADDQHTCLGQCRKWWRSF